MKKTSQVIRDHAMHGPSIPRLIPEKVFVRRMTTSAEAIAEAVADGRLFFVIREERRFYPSFFLDKTRCEKRHLAAVVKLLTGVVDVAKWLFFTTPKGSLGAITPLAALEQRRFAAVKRAAEGFSQR